MDARHCTLCPRRCGADRTKGRGRCGMGDEMTVARAALHAWEEPCISGTRGSGAIFFSGCALGCLFCQNAEISTQGKGQTVSVARLSALFLRLQAEGAHNINLVNPTHFAPWIAEALKIAKPALRIPVVYNTGGYDSAEALEEMRGLVDVYLPDFKYVDPGLSAAYSGAADYFAVASRAIQEMYRQVGPVQRDKDGLLQKGVLIRHLLLPGCRKDAMAVIDHIKSALPVDKILFSLMSQYTPCDRAVGHAQLGRRVTTFEYDSVLAHAQQAGLCGYGQARSAATTAYTPAFDGTGL